MKKPKTNNWRSQNEKNHDKSIAAIGEFGIFLSNLCWCFVGFTGAAGLKRNAGNNAVTAWYSAQANVTLADVQPMWCFEISIGKSPTLVTWLLHNSNPIWPHLPSGQVDAALWRGIFSFLLWSIRWFGLTQKKKDLELDLNFQIFDMNL